MNEGKFRNIDGFSLIEVLTSLLVITLLLGSLLSGLIYINTISKKAETNQKRCYSERYLNLYFQKQILCSEKIYLKNGRIYLQDLESSEYYNYYLYSSGFLRRYKVSQYGLKLIGSGENSQFADNIQSFSLTLGADREIILKYSLVIDGVVYFRETIIGHGNVVELV